MKDYIRNDTLYGRLLDAAGDDKLPVLDNKTFESMNAEYGKEEMRKNLADYIATERPVFPLKEICPDWIHPLTGKSIDDLINELSEIDKKSILKVQHT